MPATIQKILKPTKYRAVDTSGNNNHGQIYSGRGLEFDGVSDYLDTNVTLSTAQPTKRSYLFWMKYETSLNNQLVFDDRETTNSRGHHFFIRESDAGSYGDVAEFRIKDDADATTIIRSGDTALYMNTWVRVAYVWDGTVGTHGTLYGYINGQLVGSSALSNALATAINKDLFIGSNGSGTSNYTGMLSDFQVWDTALSASDVTFDYLNPESLALNNGGTSLTESNLKLWYPMQDGHRGQQSYVLDGANTGTQDVLSGYGTFTDASKWEVHANADANNYWTIDTSAQTMRIVSDNSEYIDASFHDTTILEVGQTYKITVEVTDATSGSIRIMPRSGGANQSSYSQGTLSTIGTHEFYYASAEKTGIAIARNSACDITIKNLTVEAVNAKHHATTVFHGDDLFDAGVGDYGDSTGGWTAEGSNTIANDSSALKITYVDDDDGARLDLNDAEDLTTDLTLGRTYRLEWTYKVNTDDGTTMVIQINIGDGTFTTSAGLTETSFTTLTKDFVCTGTAANAEIKINNMDAGDILWLKNISIKEVGTASGWTDADQQLDIPQTALQSYNQLWYMKGDHDKATDEAPGEDGQYRTASNVTQTSPQTVSCWVFPNDAMFDGGLHTGTHNSFGIWSMITYAAKGCRLLVQNTGAIRLQYGNASGTPESGNFTLKINMNKWNHIALVARNTGNCTLYVNGESETISLSSTGVVQDDQKLSFGMGGGLDHAHMSGAFTEMAWWNSAITNDTAQTLYNGGKALDARECGDIPNLYWKNSGANDCKDLIGDANDLDVVTADSDADLQTLLLPAGVDASRDNQGFLMNRQKDTNALNLNNPAGASENAPTAFVKVLDSPSFDHVDASKSYFSVALWYKRSNASDEGILFAKYDINSLREFDIEIVGNGHVEIQLGANSGAGYNRIRTRDGAIDDTDWNHLVVAYNGNSSAPETPGAWATDATGRFQMNGRIQVWRNGVEVSDGADEWQWLAGTSGHEAIPPAQLTELGGNISIGNILTSDEPYNVASAGDVYWFDGQIDDVLYYTKTLSLAEVLRIYNAGKRSHR